MFKKKTKKESESTLLITNSNQKNSRVDYNEIYRHIRTNIEYSAVGQDIKVINITSAAPSESKSTTSLNLAMIYAAKYPKVLLIDADLKKPVLHKYLKLSNTNGLTNALIDYDKNKKINQSYFQKITDKSFVGELSVLTSGIKVPNPSELLSKPIFEEFIKFYFEDLKDDKKYFTDFTTSEIHSTIGTLRALGLLKYRADIDDIYERYFPYVSLLNIEEDF